MIVNDVTRRTDGYYGYGYYYGRYGYGPYGSYSSPELDAADAENGKKTNGRHLAADKRKLAASNGNGDDQS